MRYFLITICLVGSLLFPVVLEAAIFDWSLGQPTITDDNTNTTYYCWRSGRPTVCYQYQEVAPPPSGEVISNEQVWFE